jgi:hypothetical protein
LTRFRFAGRAGRQTAKTPSRGPTQLFVVDITLCPFQDFALHLYVAVHANECVSLIGLSSVW